MTLYDLMEYAKIGILTMHDGDQPTADGLLDEINNQRILWDDLLGEQLEDLELSVSPYADGSEPEDFDGESHFVNEDDGFTQLVEGNDWD